MKIQIFSKKIPSQSMEMVRIEESFKAIDCSHLQEYLMNPDHANKMNPSFKENYVISEEHFSESQRDNDSLGEMT